MHELPSLMPLWLFEPPFVVLVLMRQFQHVFLFLC